MVAQQHRYARIEIDDPDRLDPVSTLFRIVLIVPIAIVLSMVSAAATSTTDIYQSGELVEKTTSTGGGIAGGLFSDPALMILFRQRNPLYQVAVNRGIRPPRRGSCGADRDDRGPP